MTTELILLGTAGGPMTRETASAPHIEPLDALAARLRRAPSGASRFVPSFDPQGGGIDARVLVLLESPATSTVRSGAEALSSEDNPNASSRVFRAARIDSGIGRNDYVRWNIIPWATGATRAPTPDDLDLAQAALHELLGLLPGITGIVTLGTPALNGVMRYLTLHPNPVIVPVFAAPHPSPANGHRRAERYERMVNALRRALR